VGSLAFAGVGFKRPSRAQSAKPNIVFILADDLGYADVSCYGQTLYTTPNVDRLAVEGLRFMQAYSNSANCSPTRTALATGRYQMRLEVGLEEPINATTPRGVGLPPSHPTLPSILRKAGYGTTLVGKWHLGFLPDYSPLKSGYDRFFGIFSGAADYFNHGPDHKRSGDEAGQLYEQEFLGPELLSKRVALLKEALPTISEVTALWHPNAYSERTMSDMIKQSDDAARLQLRPVAVMAPTIWRRPSQGIAATAMSAAIVVILRSIRFTFRVPHKVARMREATSGHTWLNQLIGPHVATLMRATDASLSTSPGIC
jgi:hypothetical protein